MAAKIKVESLACDISGPLERKSSRYFGITAAENRITNATQAKQFAAQAVANFVQLY